MAIPIRGGIVDSLEETFDDLAKNFSVLEGAQNDLMRVQDEALEKRWFSAHSISAMYQTVPVLFGLTDKDNLFMVAFYLHQLGYKCKVVDEQEWDKNQKDFIGWQQIEWQERSNSVC